MNEPLSQTTEKLSRGGSGKQESSRLGDQSERCQRIAAIRAEIAAGTYETPQRLEAAVDRFYQQFQRQLQESAPTTQPPNNQQ